MATRNPTSASTRLRSDPLARCLLPENVYAAVFLLDLIGRGRVPMRERPLLEKARREIRNGDVTEETLEHLVTLNASQ